MNNKLNICLISPNVFPVPAVKGGACETLVETLVKKNEEYNRINLICVSIYNEEALRKSKEYKNTKFIYIDNQEKKNEIDLSYSKKSEAFIDYMDKVYENIKELKIDYIVIEGGNLKEYKYLLSKFPKEKRIAHFHGNFIYDSEYDEIYEYFLSVSKFVANNFIKTGLKEKERIKVLYNGIELDKFEKKVCEEENEILRKKYNIKENDNIVIFCGRITENKGIRELICGFKKIKNLNNSKLIIVGNSIFGNNAKTEFDKELETISEEVKDKIIFTNYIHNEELYKIYSLADFAVVPTMSEEAFGLVVVEFLASGLPLIVTDSGAFPEIVNEDVSITVTRDENIIYSIANAIDYLIEHPEKRAIMKSKTREVAQRFSADKFYNNFCKIISELKR